MGFGETGRVDAVVGIEGSVVAGEGDGEAFGGGCWDGEGEAGEVSGCFCELVCCWGWEVQCGLGE